MNQPFFLLDDFVFGLDDSSHALLISIETLDLLVFVAHGHRSVELCSLKLLDLLLQLLDIHLEPLVPVLGCGKGVIKLAYLIVELLHLVLALLYLTLVLFCDALSTLAMSLFLLKFLLDCLQFIAGLVTLSNPTLHVCYVLFVLLNFLKELADQVNFLVKLLFELHRLLDHFLLLLLL